MRLKALAGGSPEFSQAALLVHGQHLIKLELDLELQCRGWDSAPILDILPQACPLLESLSILDCAIFLSGLMVVLRACDHLTELVLQAEG